MIQNKDIFKPQQLADVYGFTIDESNPDSLTCVSYTDKSIFYNKGSSAWDNSPVFSGIRPCLFQNGAVVGYLNKNDFTKFENGNDADITSGTAGDVMIEIPKMAILKSKVGTVITFKIFVGNGAAAVDSRFTYLAHSRAALGDVDKIYIGAYLGTNVSNVMRSLSGKNVVFNETLTTSRTHARAKGTNYQMYPFFANYLMQVLYILRYGSLDGQTALGRGYVDVNTTAANTGGTNARGMYYGETTGKLQMRFAGIEDFWGNFGCKFDGAIRDSTGKVSTTPYGFNDTGAGYMYTLSPTAPTMTAYQMLNIHEQVFSGFIPIGATNATTPMGYRDYVVVSNPGSGSYFCAGNGNYYTQGDYNGPFRLDFTTSATYGYVYSRLCYI